MHLPPPSFKPPINTIGDINSEIMDAFTIRLLWNYDFEVDSFKIYHTSTEDNEQVQHDSFQHIFSIGIKQVSPDLDSLFDYYVDIESLAYGKWHYFYISAVQGEYESNDNALTPGISMQIDSPDVYAVDNSTECELNNYDEDCKLIIVTPVESSVDIDSLFLIQKIISEFEITIDTLYVSSNIDTTFLGLQICSDGGEDDLFIPAYCDLVPNVDYTVLHYFEQVSNNSEEIRRSDSTSFIVNFVRAPVDDVELGVDINALTYQSCRLYFDNNILGSYYHSILIHDDNNTILKTATIDTLKIVNNKIILDIENIVDEPPWVYCKILGDNSFSVSMNPILLTTLPDDLVGFRLVELDGEDSADLYMSIYEIPEDYDPNTGLLKGAIPWEASYCDVKTFINELNIEYQNQNYGFRLPIEDDWNAICGWNFSDYQNFPWGSEIQAHNANYRNSLFPEGSNGITEVGLHPYPNVNGIYDLSGNVMEWLESGACAQEPPLDTAKAGGGAYFSPPGSLACVNIFNVPVTDSTGMGFHLILEINQ